MYSLAVLTSITLSLTSFIGVQAGDVPTKAYSVAFPTTCTPASTSLPNVAGAYPDNWKIATSGILNSQEFIDLKKSIDWTKAPNFPPRTALDFGVLDTTGYDADNDPACWWTVNGCTQPKLAGLNHDINKCLEPGTLGYTFDDGPNCTDPYLYDYLKDQNQLTTLFYVGSNVQNWPDRAVRGFQDGHQIAVHTWSHPMLTTLTNDEVLAELYYTRKVIKDVVGVSPLYFRPPFGDLDDRVRWIAKQLNMEPIMWNIDSFDWAMQPAGSKTPSEIDANFQTWIQKYNNGDFSESGAIQLQHELNEGTIEKAIQWYPTIKSTFKNLVNVAACSNVTYPYEEKDCANCKFATFSETKSVVDDSNGSSKNSASGIQANSGLLLGSALVASLGVIAVKYLM